MHTTPSAFKLHVMAKTKGPSKAADKPKTTQRTYRFNNELFEAFEDDCARHLSNPRLVIEALIRHWLDADGDARAAIAHRHRDWAGGAGDEE